MANEALPLLSQTAITTAVTAQVGTVLEFGRRALYDGTLIVLAKFAYGSGGTTVKAWLQTSLDNGTTWVDIASAAFTTSAATKVYSLTTRVAPASQGFAPADAALADNTVVNGILGDRLRVKYTTTGTYAGTTHLTIWGTFKRGAG